MGEIEIDDQYKCTDVIRFRDKVQNNSKDLAAN